LDPAPLKLTAPGARMNQFLFHLMRFGRDATHNAALAISLCLLLTQATWTQPTQHTPSAAGATVMLDAWFNSQQRVNAGGQKEYFHYKWNDTTNSGFSILGSIFTSFGARLDTIYSAPTLEKLKGAKYYIIVSPDIPVKNPQLNYVQPEDAEQVAEWVRQGGVLLLMENDPANADIDHLNLIADRFGLHFNAVLSHHVIGDAFTPGQIAVDGKGPVFYEPHILYMKDTCTLTLRPPAKALLEDKGDIMMAIAPYGKGKAIAVVDPWLYNEYAQEGLKGPARDNYAAGKEFVRWLLKQSSSNKSTASAEGAL
jgi:unsaturated rhamnogalacturonyl hydrolase